MTPFFCERFGNPSEPHRLGREARSAVDEARARVAALLAGPVVTKLADLAIDGQDVMKALGCPPGRHVGDLLRRLEARVVDEPELNRREDLLRLLAELAPPGSLPGPARG